jgi:hypothetical protein
MKSFPAPGCTRKRSTSDSPPTWPAWTSFAARHLPAWSSPYSFASSWLSNEAVASVFFFRVVDPQNKHIDLNESMVRAIARQAEAERERRAKVIHAEGEKQASAALLEAARMLALLGKSSGRGAPAAAQDPSSGTPG